MADDVDPNRLDQLRARGPEPEPPDLESLAESLKASADLVRGIWISFLLFATYLAIAVGAVTHRDLFLENPVKLPVLNVDLPLTGFFFVAPFLLLLYHLYLLVQLAQMAERAARYRDELGRHGLAESVEAAKIADLPPHVFVRVLAGRDVGDKSVGWLIRLIAWITVAVGPVVLLLLTQIKFLPYHHSPLTWWHRGLIAADLALLALLWPAIIRGHGRTLNVRELWSWAREGRWRLIWEWLDWRGSWQAVPAMLVFLASIAVMTFPGERLHRELKPETSSDGLPMPTPWHGYLTRQALFEQGWRANLHHLLFAGAVDEVTGERRSPFSATLVLPDQIFVDEKRFDTPAKLDAAPCTVSLRGRDLRGAVLTRADLRKADFTGANLNGAKLDQARLEKGSFGCAQSGGHEGARCTQLQGASLDSVQLWRVRGRPQTAGLISMPSLGHAPVPERPDGFAAWRDGILSRIPGQEAKARAAERLDVLSATASAPDDALDRTDWVMQPGPPPAWTNADRFRTGGYWRGVRDAQPVGDAFTAQLAGVLAELACGAGNAPHVAAGLVRDRILETPRAAATGKHIHLFAARLNKSRPGAKDFDETACPGVKGMPAERWGDLDDLVRPAPPADPAVDTGP